MKAFVADLVSGSSVDSLFSVKYKRAVEKYANGWRFSFGVADKTGEIEASYWGGDDRDAVARVHDSFREGEVVRVVGIAGVYKDRKKIDINEGKGSVSVATDYNLADFLPESTKDITEMYSEVLSMVNGVGHAGLKKLLEAFFLDPEFGEAFRRAPGAMSVHHAWVGGLLEHSLSVAKTARAASANYDVDLDLLTAGALLHDIGKMRELQVTTSIKIGQEGMLLGHPVMGFEMVRRKAEETGLDSHTLLKLSHMMLAHHGKLEYGSPKVPMFVEAILVYYADEMDSKASQFERIRKDTNSEDFRVWDKFLGEIYLK